jgi:hypothetical protein
MYPPMPPNAITELHRTRRARTFEKLGFNPKDFIILTTPPKLLRSLESRFCRFFAQSANTVFCAAKRLLPGARYRLTGGNAGRRSKTLIETTTSKPNQVRKVIRVLQTAKDAMRKSKDKALELMARTLKIDRDRLLHLRCLSHRSERSMGCPARQGMNDLVLSVKSQARFADRNLSFAEVADDTLAKEVAKDLAIQSEVNANNNR